MTSVLQRMVDNPLARRAADAAFARYARRRLAVLNARDPAASQRATLRRLIATAADTRFGRDHGFVSIHSVADYRRRVPLRDYEQFWRDYWQPGYPRLQGVTWPRPIPYYALSSGTTSGATKFVPVSQAMLRSNHTAALTTLAMFAAARPQARLFRGRLFFFGSSTELRRNDDGSHTGDLSGIAAREFPDALRPYAFPPPDLASVGDWEVKVQRLAEASATLPVTALSGIPAWVLILLERVMRVAGRDRLIDVWPQLRLMIHGGTKFDPYRELFRRVVGSDDVTFLETYPASEGFIAVEDLRYNLLRLIPDHGIFFEFVPVAELGTATPARHTVGEVEPGVQYAVALTTCAGLWSYLIGDTVCFERRDPPLLRFTGRTKYFLSAFGEHLISEEVERAVAAAASATEAAVVDFHVGPVFPDDPTRVGRHRYLIEFADAPASVDAFASELDAALCRANEDYAAHRVGDLSMLRPEVVLVRRGGFAEWMRSRGKLGGQHKVPRMDNDGAITRELSEFLR